MIRLAALLILVAPFAARAQDSDAPTSVDAPPHYKAGLKGMVGTGGYVGRGAYLQLGFETSVKASYSDYRYDGSTGTTRTFGLKLAHQAESWSFSANASATPLNDSYSNRAWGVEGSYIVSLGSDDDDGGLDELEFGGWWGQTRHHQRVPATPLVPAPRDVIINQHDLGLTTSLTGWDFTLSLDGSKSHYDQDFSILPRAALLRPRLGEAVELVNGFPDASGAARLEWARYRAFIPYAGVTVTRFKLQPQPNSTTSSVGATVKWEGLSLDLGYERTRVKGAPDSKYLTFAGAYKF